jgi:hypothetical protein
VFHGSGFSFGGGNFAGAFAAKRDTGAIKWLQDRRGGIYSVAVTGTRLCGVGHAHNPNNIGGFGEVKPNAYRALSVGLKAAAT